MNDQEYRKLLLSAAFHAMTCDGELHEDEMDSIRRLSEKSKIFGEIELDEEFSKLSIELKESTRRAFRKFFEELQNSDLEISSQLQVVEVVIRVIYSDGRIDENEIMYLKKIVSILGVLPELLQQRFGSIGNLLGMKDAGSYESSPTVMPDFEPPEIGDLDEINFTPLSDPDFGSDSK